MLNESKVPFKNSPIDLHGMPLIEEEKFEKLPLRYRKLRGLFCLIGIVVLSFLIGGPLLWISVEEEIGFATLNLLWWPMAVWFCICGIWLIEEVRGFSRRGFLVRDRDLSVRRGYLFHSLTTVPFTRIQHSEVIQGPMLRLFNLCTLKVYTAGSSGANLQIPGMDPHDAERIRTIINERSEG